MKVLYVGDRPSLKNWSPDVAFLGSPSGKRLAKWLEQLPGVPLLTNQSYGEDVVKGLAAECGTVIALGQEASKKLDAWLIPHFTLPHPSGLNRQLNDEAYVKEQLIKAAVWIRLSSRLGA